MPERIRAAALRLLTHLILCLKGDLQMMAMLFACRVVEGRTEWARVPAKLKAPVAGIILGDFALPELVPAEYGGTADAGAANAGTAATGAAAAGAAGTGAQA